MEGESRRGSRPSTSSGVLQNFFSASLVDMFLNVLLSDKPNVVQQFALASFQPPGVESTGKLKLVFTANL